MSTNSFNVYCMILDNVDADYLLDVDIDDDNIVFILVEKYGITPL